MGIRLMMTDQWFFSCYLCHLFVTNESILKQPACIQSFSLLQSLMYLIKAGNMGLFLIKAQKCYMAIQKAPTKLNMLLQARKT